MQMNPIFQKILSQNATIRIDLLTGEAMSIMPGKIMILYSARTRDGGELYGTDEDGLKAIIAVLSCLDAKAFRELADGLKAIAELGVENAAFYVQQGANELRFSGWLPEGNDYSAVLLGIGEIVAAADKIRATAARKF